MTKDQIANEKVALQKALLYYESIHGRPVCGCSKLSLWGQLSGFGKILQFSFIQKLGTLKHALFSSTRKETSCIFTPHGSVFEGMVNRPWT